MIHIIDPQTQSLLLEPRVWGQKSKTPVRYIHDRNLICAELVAIREPSGLYRVIKCRWGNPPRLIRRKTLQRYIDETLEHHS